MHLRTLILTLLSATYAIQSFAAPTTESTNPAIKSTTSDDKIILNFENADIQAVIKAISKLSGKNFVIDPRVKGTVNIVSEKPISKSESYKVLESALRMQGFATVEADGVIKVLPEADAKTYAMRSDIGGKNPGDQLITKVFSIENGSATQISNAIRPIVSQNNSISVYPNSNAIIVTDYASNLARVAKIIDSLNATAKTKLPPTIIKLKYIFASDAAQTLQSYLGTGNSSGGGSGGSAAGGGSENGPAVNITIDSSSNSLILTSNSQVKLEEVKKLAQTLDTETKNTNNNLHVIYLKNADAAHVAEVLKVIASGQDNPDIGASPSQRYLSDTSSMMNSSSSGGSGGSGGMPSSGGTGNSQSQKSSGSSSTSQTANSDKNAPKILIQAEPTTNSLIIQAPEAAYRNFRSIIEMLDVRRVQVMIEALIADINTKNQGSFGIQWVGGAGNNNAGIGMISNYGGNGSSLSSLATTAMGLMNPGTGSQLGQSGIPNEVYVGLVTGTVQVGGQTIPGISTLANMIAATSAGNILGRPTLLTLDNEEASIFVGMNIGLPSGSYQNTGANAGNLVTTVNRQDVGTALKLKPLVTQSGAIQLSVFQEDSKVDPNMPTGVYANNGANILKRNMKTQIIVNDGQIIALGGMTSDSITLQNSGIPLLSSIPYLGWLFSWQNRIHEKTNLVIFLKPTIIRNEEGMRALTNQRYRYILDQQKAIHAEGNLLLPRIDAVTLENQVPYTDKLPAQPVTEYDGKIVDLRTSNQNTASEQQATTGYTSSNSGITVKQTAPNAISIMPSTPQ
ncbi:MAG: type II secretion system secretin GspD [Burkholderiales bacterium]|nr:type II secretion system secretin GspD [Burkholderiales bacterium]